jgi:putative hydrolase of the HAD superfamily
MDFKKYKHISFDLWLTLIKSNPDYKFKRSQLLAGFFDIPFDAHHINSIVKKHDVQFNRLTEITGRHIYQGHMWLIILSELGCNIEEIPQQRLQEFYQLQEKLFLENSPVLIDEESDKTLNKLTAQGITINLLSNTGFIEGRLLRTVLAGWGLDKYFSFQLYSDETGFSKPGAGAFESLFDHIQKINAVNKSEVLHIGDNKAADIIGAESFGLSAALLLPNQKISMLINN